MTPPLCEGYGTDPYGCCCPGFGGPGVPVGDIEGCPYGAGGYLGGNACGWEGVRVGACCILAGPIVGNFAAGAGTNGLVGRSADAVFEYVCG